MLLLLFSLYATAGSFQLAGRRHSPLIHRRHVQTNANVDVGTDYDRIQHLSYSAIAESDLSRKCEYLTELSELCAQRRPFSFEDDVDGATTGSDSVISKLPNLLPSAVTRKIFDKVETMLQKGWLSTNPDSVDGMPSFHLNLVSDGESIANVRNPDDFQQEIQSMLDMVGPFIYDKLLPHVKAQLGTDTIEVSDIFIRRYGQDVLDGQSRNGISAHYDVFSRVTSVVALDNAAQEGRNGLFTTVKDTGTEGDTRTSNHAALRRFFPLECGDAVVHTWDVLHGVDVEPGMDRTSVIVWFTEKISNNDNNNAVSPWLVNHPKLETDNVAQFVLASALESAAPPALENSGGSGGATQSMHQQAETSANPPLNGMQRAIELYISSAARGNGFAMTRLGSLLEEGLLDEAALCRAQNAVATLEAVQPPSEDMQQWLVCDSSNHALTLARQFWYQASLRGVPLAQVALADELLMMDDKAPRDTAATLFGLAAQQGHEEALDSLARLIRWDMAQKGVSSREAYEASPVVQIARAATAHLAV